MPQKGQHCQGVMPIMTAPQQTSCLASFSVVCLQVDWACRVSQPDTAGAQGYRPVAPVPVVGLESGLASPAATPQAQGAPISPSLCGTKIGSFPALAVQPTAY